MKPRRQQSVRYKTLDIHELDSMAPETKTGSVWIPANDSKGSETLSIDMSSLEIHRGARSFNAEDVISFSLFLSASRGV